MMYNSMEDNGQYYNQCVSEVKGCKLVSVDLQNTHGPISMLVFNDTGIAKVMSRMNAIGYEYDGTTRVHLLIKN